jgi:hypothetical protein
MCVANQTSLHALCTYGLENRSSHCCILLNIKTSVFSARLCITIFYYIRYVNATKSKPCYGTLFVGIKPEQRQEHKLQYDEKPFEIFCAVGSRKFTEYQRNVSYHIYLQRTTRMQVTAIFRGIPTARMLDINMFINTLTERMEDNVTRAVCNNFNIILKGLRKNWNELRIVYCSLIQEPFKF